MMLNMKPEMIIQIVTTPKKTPINFIVITFFRSIASGKDIPTTPIMKAIAVPRGIPLATKTGTSTNWPITAAKASPELMPKTATAIANSKLLLTAANESVVVFS